MAAPTNTFLDNTTIINERKRMEGNTKCYLRTFSATADDLIFGHNKAQGRMAQLFNNTIDSVSDGGLNSNLLQPLQKNLAVEFPITPTVQIGATANYDAYQLSHTNYRYNSYDSSAPNEISISADFIVQNVNDSRYLLAVMHFFRSITKSYFGKSDSKFAPVGSPPAILAFNYLGDKMYKDIPVIIKDYAYTLQPDVDYVEVPYTNTKVPTFVNIMLTLDTIYSPKTLRDFNLNDFRKGTLMQGNQGLL